MRGSTRVLAEVFNFLDIDRPVPSHQSTRDWLMRLGLAQLNQPLTLADDWVWIIDATVQAGTDKCLAIVGVRLSQLKDRDDLTLRRDDLSLLHLDVLQQCNGDIVEQHLKQTIARTGVPRLIVRDEGADLRKAGEQFTDTQPHADVVYDVTHKTACVLKREFEGDPRWADFKLATNSSRKKLQQTELAFVAPPTQRSKARYMSVSPVIEWMGRMLRLLDSEEKLAEVEAATPGFDRVKFEQTLGWLREYREESVRWGEWISVCRIAETHVRTRGHYRGSSWELGARFSSEGFSSSSDLMREDLLNFVEEESSKARPGERLLGTSDVIESVFGRYKELADTQSKGGFSGLILSLGALLSPPSVSQIREALVSTPLKMVTSWVRNKLGKTQSSKRQSLTKLLKTPEQKPDTNS